MWTLHLGKSTKTYLTIYGACRAWAEHQVELQLIMGHRCVCGRRDLFCDFRKNADLKLCRKKKQKRVYRLASRAMKRWRKDNE